MASAPWLWVGLVEAAPGLPSRGWDRSDRRCWLFPWMFQLRSQVVQGQHHRSLEARQPMAADSLHHPDWKSLYELLPS